MIEWLARKEQFTDIEESATCERGVERLVGHVLRNWMRVVDTALDGERERHDREEEKKAQHEAQERQITVRMCAINVHGGASVCCPAEILTSANGEGSSVTVQLSLSSSWTSLPRPFRA
jgi:hypothetical protein